jgi:4-hydroxythreonine-4-phosphate dehydrogenase
VTKRVCIGLTQGDPKGIGPELCATALDHFARDPEIMLRLYGDPTRDGPMHALTDAAAGAQAARWVTQAAHDIQRGEIAALVTAPIHKGRWHAAGITAPGHTEFLARCVSPESPPDTRMLFVAGTMRIALITCHLPLAHVPAALTPESIRTTVVLTMDALRQWWDIATPRLALLGLNPHAGEDGLLGSEEQTIFRPLCTELRASGLAIDGPLAADGLFAHAAARYDAIIACYHDQGLIPIKMLAPHAAINITMGLPFIRTSVGHGTADDIAGRGMANPDNLLAAIRLAASLHQRGEA